jgi:hypothetical protein
MFYLHGVAGYSKGEPQVHTMSFTEKIDQSLAKFKVVMIPLIDAFYKEAVDGYINLRKRGTILLKTFCHNAINFCMGLSVKSFAALALVPAVLLLATVDLSSRGERDAQQMKAAISAQLQNTRANTQTTHAGIDMQHTQAGKMNQAAQQTQTGAPDAAAQRLADTKRIVPPIISSEAFLTFTQETQTARDAEAYLKEGLKAAQKMEPAAGP